MATPAAPPQSERTLAAVAYLLTWVTGLIILLLAKKEDRYTRWNAIQAIGLGIVATVVSIVLNLVGLGGGFGFGMMMGGGILGSIWGLLILIAVIVCAVKAYQGEPFRIPLVVDFADKNA